MFFIQAQQHKDRSCSTDDGNDDELMTERLFERLNKNWSTDGRLRSNKDEQIKLLQGVWCPQIAVDELCYAGSIVL